MFDVYIMDSVESLKDYGQEEEEVVRCCDFLCNCMFKYRKCCICYEQNIYSLFVEEEIIDKVKIKKFENGIFNYGCFYISFGFLICDVEDVVKEGDGDRLIRVWKFFIFFYCLNGVNKYVLVGFCVQVLILGLFIFRDVYRFKWNRFVGF